MRPPPRRRALGPVPASQSGAHVTDPRHELGRRAEDAAATWLSNAGWQVLDRRWRAAVGELDIVCRDPTGMLVAVEVKLRRTRRTGAPLEAIDRRRLGRLRAALGAYAAGSMASWSGLRVDLVTVEPEDSLWRLRRHPGIDGP